MWFVFSLLTVLAWGTSETIFKRSSDGDEQSVVRLLAYNGVFFGLSGVVYMLIVYRGFHFNPAHVLTYFPVAATYIVSMFSYYHAMSRVKISLISPIVNSSCVVTVLLSVAFLHQRPNPLQTAAIICIIVSIIGISMRKDGEEPSAGAPAGEGRAASYGAYAAGLLFALGYFLLDGVASFLDAYTLEDTLSEEDVLISYALIYLVVGVACHVYLRLRDKSYRLRLDKLKFAGTLFETAGQYTFVYAMGAGQSAIVSPFVASYSAVTIILSRLFLKEKLSKIQYFWAVVILAGIIALSFE